MSIKLFYQFILICIILIISTIFFKKYFKSEQKVENLEIVENKLDLNVIKDIKYFSKDTKGNTYEIIADSGVTDAENPNLIKLKNVNAKIIFDKKKEVLISSNYAIYNQENYDTEFNEGVMINYTEHKIRCNKLNAFFSKNIATLEGDLIYNNLNTELLADVMEIDLISKSTKTFMINNNEKVQINYIKDNGNN
tara:strand:- start:1442 stop:2023 length:582 start_codon:yes stop_codon:yes gene_type:complete